MKTVATIWFVGAMLLATYAGYEHPNEEMANDRLVVRRLVVCATWPLAMVYAFGQQERRP